MKEVVQRVRSWGIDQTSGLMNLVEKICYADRDHPIGWKDHLRWWLDGKLSTVFGWFYDGSDEEIMAVYQSELPVAYMSVRQRAVLTLPRSEYGSFCVHCAWEGLWSEVSCDEICPDCGNAVYVGPFLPDAPEYWTHEALTTTSSVV